MEFKCALFVVKDIQVSRDFYENMLGQKVKYNFGENITFEGDFSIQESYSFVQMVSINCETIGVKAHNSEWYFETENLDAIVEKLDKCGKDIFFCSKAY